MWDKGDKGDEGDEGAGQREQGAGATVGQGREPGQLGQGRGTGQLPHLLRLLPHRKRVIVWDSCPVPDWRDTHLTSRRKAEGRVERN
jgi:hypothetical protein